MNSFIARSSASFCLPAHSSSRIFAEVLVCALVRVVVRLARPDGALVELDALVVDAAEDHRAQPAVADGQGFHPQIRGLAVPEGERGLRGKRGG